MKHLCLLRIPKTASTTLATMLDQHFDPSEIIRRQYFGKNALHVTREEFEAQSQKLLQYKLIHGHYAADVLMKYFPDAIFLTVLRDPLDRVVSLYNDWHSKSDENLALARDDEKEFIHLARTLPIGQLLRSGHDLLTRMFHNAQARQLVAPLYLGLPPDPDAACANLDHFDVVGTTEMLAPTTMLICSLMGWSHPNQLPKLNQSRGSTTTNDLDAPTRELIHEITQADQIVYRYAQSKLANLLSEHLRAPAHKATPVSTTPPAADFTFHARDPIDGDGWHVLEGENEKTPWRWTGPGRSTTLKLPLASNTKHRITLRVISVIAEDILQGTHLLINGHPLDITNQGVIDGQHELHADIPAWMIQTDAHSTLSILVPRTLSHAEIQPETGDHRPKGLAITEVRVSRVGGA